MELYHSLMKNKSIRNGTLFSVFSFINKGFSFFLLLIMANLMTPSEYGYLNLFNTLVMIIGVIIALSSEGYLSISYFQDGTEGVRNTVSVILAISVAIMLTLMTGVFLSFHKLSFLLELPNALLYIAILICFFSVFINVLLNYFRIKEKVITYGIISCGCALIDFVISFLFVKTMDLGWRGRAYAHLLCMLFFGGLSLVYFYRKGFFKFRIKEHIRPILFWSLPLIPHLATNFIRQGCDRYIINYYHTISDVGFFSFSLTLMNIITMIGFGFNQSNSVDIYKKLSDNSISSSIKMHDLLNQRNSFAKIYLVTTILAVASVYFLIPIIMPEYVKSIDYFLVLSFYGFGVCIYLLYTNYLFYYKKTRQIMYITFGSAIIHLLMSVYFTQFSLIYTAIIYDISQLIVVLLTMRYTKITLSKELH